MRRRGFTLVEVLIALSIAATAFVTLAAVLRGNVKNRLESQAHEHVSARLSAKLNEIICGVEAAISGELSAGLRWQAQSRPFDLPGTNGLTLHEIWREGNPDNRISVITYEPPPQK